jgi:hypothetical protein
MEETGMKKLLFALGAIALLAEPVAAMPVHFSSQEPVVGVQPEKTVTYAGAAHRSTRRTARRVNRR